MEGFCCVNFVFLTSFSCLLCLRSNSSPARFQFIDDVSLSIDPSLPTELTGDFNTILSRSLDRRRSDPFDASRVFPCALNRLLDACSSVGFWR